MEGGENGDEVGDSYRGLGAKIDRWICGNRWEVCARVCVLKGCLIDVKKMRRGKKQGVAGRKKMREVD